MIVTFIHLCSNLQSVISNILLKLKLEFDLNLIEGTLSLGSVSVADQSIHSTPETSLHDSSGGGSKSTTDTGSKSEDFQKYVSEFIIINN